ncbi:methyltransferase domain-containing protein [Luteibacter yeojuensis]|uniref:Methyltransferase domain-containing protein n=1 Tax=Luteibacter yeojuensis TaxID=345309 RepID=A0A7X5QUV9_9GAMM|nr:methyltransferase domain-containing protein [Luteibacter yeojuensis]NID15765.1 methyltransferase domain-containing protein [Luteibacter yeojuensis]
MALYENPFHHDNVYGHVVTLLSKHTAGATGLHLDFGCNVGPIAESIRDDLAREYIGFDIDEDALQILRGRGFDAHRADLTRVEETEQQILKLVAGRSVASISIIDTLEHLPNGPDVLSMLRRIAASHNASLVTSVPNVAHRDVGFKLAFGKWDYTPKGLLDYTHVHFFTEDGLRAMMNQAGWHETASHDVFVEISDQHFPANHPAIATSSSLHRFLGTLRASIDSNDRVNQFIRLWLPGPSKGRGHVRHEEAKPRPFLTVVTRTQGRRLDTLRDVLLCLSAQSDPDFEVCVIGHKLTESGRLAVERIIEDTNSDLRHRIRLIKIDSGNRTRPLNVGFREARGEYVAILDDDDVVLGHWVEEFKKLADKAPGTVLRAANVAQLWQPVRTSVGTQAVRAVGSPRLCYPTKFDYLDHLIENATPPVSLAFPRSAFADLRIEFDESLTTTEDWDFLMRTVAVCGTSSSDEITSIYRQWDGAESSFTVHTKQEWLDNHHAIWRKLDAIPLLLPEGSAAKIRRLLSDYHARHGGRRGPAPDALHETEQYEDCLREEIHGLLHSRSWQITAPLRFISIVLGRRNGFPMLWAMNGQELEATKTAILTSRSMRVAAKIKRLLARR